MPHWGKERTMDPQSTTGQTNNTTPDAAVNNTASSVTGPGTTATPPQQPATPTPTAPTPTPTPSAPLPQPPPPSTPSSNLPKTQEEMDAVVKARIARDREERQDEEKQRAATEQGNFKGLYETEHPKYEALKEDHKTVTATVARLAEHIGKSIDEETKAWPEMAKLADPGKDSIDARMTWVEKYRPEVAKTAATPSSSVPPNPPPGPIAPPSNGTGAPGDEAARKEQSTIYSRW